MAEKTAITNHHWITSPCDLKNKYQASNQRAVEAIQKYGSSKVEVKDNGHWSYPSEIELANRKEGPLPNPLSIEEKLLLQRYYQDKILQVCGAFQLPNKVQETTIIYFKKFYQRWSIMEHNPKKIMLTCIYVACQVEDNYVFVEQFGRGLGEDLEFIYKHEMLVVESIDFDLMVQTPYRALQGFIYYLEPFVQGMGSTSVHALEGLQRASAFEVDKIMFTNVPLYYSPGLLALAALHIANKKMSNIDFEGYLKSLSNQFIPLQQLIGNLNAIKELVKAESGEPSQIEWSIYSYKFILSSFQHHLVSIGNLNCIDVCHD